MKKLAHVFAVIVLGFLPLRLQNQDINTENPGSGLIAGFTDQSRCADSILINPFNLQILAPSSGIQFYRKGIVFLANSRGDERITNKHLSFGSIKMFMAFVADSVPGPYMPFLITSSLLFPSEAITFSQDYNTMYLSLIPERGTKEEIFSADYTKSGWVIDKSPLDFCSDDYISTHPSLSTDGSFMIFSSDRIGSYGGLDLLITRKEGDKWSNPENLGEKINTSGNELFASLDNYNNLYFSSDGLPGEGGFDIYFCRYNGKEWENPVSLPCGINSQDDEVAFTINRNDGRTAFYTSRSRTGKNRMQLYKVTLESYPGDQVGSTITERFFVLAKITEPVLAAKTENVQNQEQQVIEKTEPVTSIEPVSKPVFKTQPVENKAEINATAVENVSSDLKTEDRESLIYRIQILSTTKPVGNYEVTISDKKYQTYEYIYKGVYRTTIGEFKTWTEAVKTQRLCRQNGYDQAFVVAFFNNERITNTEIRTIEQNNKVKQNLNKEKNIEPKPSETGTPLFSTSSQEKEIVFRVQLLANIKPVGTYNIKIGDKSYSTFEYFYSGAYRTTIGEFDTLTEATHLQNQCRQAGYNQAFVVVFRNGKRITDPAFFK
jgi:hypothetical protein